MAGRKKGGRRSRKSKSIPVLPVMGVAMPFVSAYQRAGGINANLPGEILFEYTGMTKDGAFSQSQALKTGGMVVGTYIAHRIANKTVNKYVRKATMGYLVL